MRFRRRMAAAILAVVMIATSVQGPDGVSYAAESGSGSAESGQEVLEPAVKAAMEQGSGSADEKDAVPGSEEGQENSAASSEGEAQPDEGAEATGGSQTEETGTTDTEEKDKTEETGTEGGETPEPDETVTEETEEPEETDEPAAEETNPEEVDLEKALAEAEEEIELTEAEMACLFQFGGAPSGEDGISLLADNDLADYLYEQMLKQTTIIDMSGYDVTDPELYRMVLIVVNEHPDLYFYDGCKDIISLDGKVLALRVKYDRNYDNDAFREKTAEALSYVSDGMSDLEKAAALHDWLALNVEYDFDYYSEDGIVSYDSYNAYGALVKGIAVCEGYTLAYKYLLRQVGIESYYVGSETMDHAWNLVKLDGQYYHVDVTWDWEDRVGRVGHNYMFCSDAFNGHHDWRVISGITTVDYKATDTTYESAFWVDSLSPLVFDGGNCYYILSEDGSLKKASFSDIADPGTTIGKVGETDFYGGYSGLFQIGGRLFYNDTRSIYSIAKDGTDKKTVFTLTNTEVRSIYGSAYCGGKVVYVLYDSLTKEEEVLTADIAGLSWYSIHYKLDGGVNDSGNPGSYTSESETITLKAPAKEGYQFGGWYKDAECQEEITQIPGGSTGDITLYAKWTPESMLDAENPEYSFTTLDGGKVSSRADGRTKMLFFFQTDSADCISESGQLKSLVGDVVNVDIYAIEINRSTKDAVSRFKEDYGCDGVTYCYDTAGTVNNAAMSAYLRAAGYSSMSAAAPVIAYIDEENRLRKVTAGTNGYSGCTVMEETLRECCGHDYYAIKWDLRGGTNNSENPGVYRSSEGAVLKDPVKPGGTFLGWYRNDGWGGDEFKFSEGVSGIPKGCKGDLKLYARWKMDAEIELGCDNFYYTFRGVDGETLSSKAEGKPKLLLFFNHEHDNGKETLRSMREVIDQFFWVDIYAIDLRQGAGAFNAEQFAKDCGCSEIKFAYADAYAPSNWVKLDDYMYAGGLGTTIWAPVICYIDKDNKLQLVTDHEQTGEQILENLQKYCGYQPPVAYQITYELDGGTNNPDNPDSYFPSKSKTIWLRDAKKEGTEFLGWYTDPEFKQPIDRISRGSTGDFTFYAKWREGLCIWNPEQTYYDLSGRALSSIPNGRPKLLVFLDALGEESKNTVRNITSVIGRLDGVDIYAIDCGTATSYDVQQFKETYGCSGITFSNDVMDDTKNAQKALEYVKLAGLSESMNYPIVCYIAKDNRLSWATEREQTGDEIIKNLEKYCDFEPQDDPPGGLETEITVTFVDSTFVYNGEEQKPEVKITTAGPAGNEITLKENTDYTLSYANNKNAGTAKVIVTGMGEYEGTVEAKFTIEPAPLVIRAVDVVLSVGDRIPQMYFYKVDGLLGKDKLEMGPTLVCDIASTAQEGEYLIIPSGADAGRNYAITYENGRLIVATGSLLWKVTFDTQGHGNAPAALSGVRSGETIKSPTEPEASGYRFDGWYREPECKKAWNFETDIVEADLTLYAKWLRVSIDGGFVLQEIPDQYYTGKALKPAVSVYDGDTLLKAGKDYQVKYYNNINANDTLKTGSGAGTDFNPKLPYVEITGKGNYKSTVKVNFNILKIAIGDSGMDPVAGAILKVNDQLVKANKAVKPSVSLKLGRALKEGTDFKLELYATDASGYVNSSLAGAEIPAGATGEFILMIKGAGNYEGSIMKYIYVADKDHLMKNAKITLGKNLKNVDYTKYTGKSIRLTPSEKDGDDVFTVRIGKNVLVPDKDYRVLPSDRSVGKAELVVEGMDAYVGSKTTTFNIKGKTFSNSTVSISGIENRTYTGIAHTQNKAAVTYKGESKPLVYGTDYTISYSKNIDKGKATMTFTGNPGAGYSGKVTKTFQIAAADINAVTKDPSMGSITVSYAKAGAKPVDEIILTSQAGVRLCNGKDYTLKYKDNKAVTAKATVTVTGKGNYIGKFDVPFGIVAADLDADHIVMQSAAAAYSENKAADFAYKPAVKVMDGKAALKAGVDYEIEYVKNTQADYKNYLEKLKAGSVQDVDVPRACITAKTGSNYGLGSDNKAIDVSLQIYQTKINKNDLDVRIGEAVYTGGQVIPDVTVSYKGEALTKGVHYKLTYGANNKAGKNKGSVTVNGLAPYYGGSVTYKFDIIGKDLNF